MYAKKSKKKKHLVLIKMKKKKRTKFIHIIVTIVNPNVSIRLFLDFRREILVEINNRKKITNENDR